MAPPNLRTPTALVAFTECAHVATLDLGYVERGEDRPRQEGAFFSLITRKGMEHEEAYLASLDPSTVISIPPVSEVGPDAALRLTREAMAAGASVIYQGYLALGAWRGTADFLERVEVTSSLGPWSYQPVDTKLARHEALPHHVLQLAVYADALAEIQGVLPERVHVQLGSGRRESVRTFDVIHYARHQRRRYEAFLAAPTETIPYPNAHCALCQHRPACLTAWREEDHPSFVARIRRDDVHDLARHDPPITTLTDLAGHDPDERVGGVKDHTLAEIVRQAQLQRETIDGETLAWEHRTREEERGFERLPEPSPGDIYLDLEGDPVWRADRSLVFLFGWIERGEGADGWEYRALWAHDEETEATRLRELVALIQERRRTWPDMHVYHYAHAEPSMLRAIATPDPAELDAFEELIAQKVFVDLYAVVRQGLRIGAESYGLKTVERLAGFRRTVDDVEMGADAVVAYEDWLGSPERDQAVLDEIAAYNEEDVRATLAVAEWLRANRPDGEIVVEEPYEPTDAAQQRLAEYARREGMAVTIAERCPDDAGAQLVGVLLNYYEREHRVARREFVEMRDLPAPERRDDSRILDGLEIIHQDGRIRTYHFPEQDHKVAKGGGTDLDGNQRYFAIDEVDELAQTVTIKFKDDDEGPDPVSIAASTWIEPRAKQDTLDAIGEELTHGVERFRASLAIARRERPDPLLIGGSAHVEQPADDAGQAAWLEAVMERIRGLHGMPYAIQGPPGTGKTWLAAQIITRLIDEGATVALTALSHEAIVNALRQIEETADERGVQIVGERYTSNKLQFKDLEVIHECYPANKADTALGRGVQLLAGTAWMCSRKALHGQIDYLVVDEAGQFGLADAIASAACATKGVILLGDPLQLPQISQARHELDGGRSVLEHLLGEEPLVPADRGLLLTRTRRMHPDVCRFISEHVYDGRLETIPACARQNTALGTGLRTVPVEHTGCSSKSVAEAERVRELLGGIVGATWTDKDGDTHTIGVRDVMVVAPYNAHVRRVEAELNTDPRLEGVRVGTVDKFQGQEAPVVVYTMATSTDEDLPRDKEFLFSRNRLNVALSRAKCLGIIVANPRLLDTRARTVEQMRLLSTLCAAWEENDA